MVAIVGNVVGRRDKAGRLHAIESEHAFFGALVDDVPANEWGDRFEGDAVLAVVDERGGLTLRGDRFGKRDVYVQRVGDGAAFASDLDLLPEAPARDGYDGAALVHTMTYYGHRPPKRHTIYRGVRRLGVGDVARGGDGPVQIEEAAFRPVPVQEYQDGELERYSDAFLDHLATSGSREGNTVLLSSGWDSSSLLAGLVHVFGPRRVTALVGRMHYSERSGNCNRFEIERAAKIAQHYGVRVHHVELDYVRPDPEWVGGVLKDFRAHNIQSLTGMNHARLMNGAAQLCPGLPVFAGEISDGAHNLGFSQYVTMFHPTQGFRQYADKMASYLFGPTFIGEFLEGRHEKDAVFGFLTSRSNGTQYDEPGDGRERRMRQMLVSFFLRNGRIPLWSGRNIRMLRPTAVEAYTTEMADEYFGGIEASAPETIYSWYLHLYNSFHWQGSTVATLQKMGDRFGLRSHTPFWDQGVQDFLSAMPESWGRGLDLAPTKYPLKRMLQEKLGFPMNLHVGPHSYTYDVDPTFNHSIEVLYHSSMAPLARSALKGKPYHQVLSPDWFDLEYLDGIVDAYLGGVEHRGAALADLVSVWLLTRTGWYA